MALPQYVDISAANSVTDWQALKNWSASFDGVSRLCIKLTEGDGFKSPTADSYVAQAKRIGFDTIRYYHYARPDLNPTWAGAQKEVNWFRKVLGDQQRPQDTIMLDYEGFPGKPNSLFPADWAQDWLHLFSGNAGVQPERCSIYSYKNFIETQLQFAPLAAWPLIYAWYTPTQPPPAPPPWTSYLAWQFTSKGRVPGISTIVDINQYTGFPASPGPDLSQVSSLITEAQTALLKAQQELKKG